MEASVVQDATGCQVTYGGWAKGIPRNEVEVPSVKPMTVASSIRTVGGPVDAETETAARSRVQDTSDAIFCNMVLSSSRTVGDRRRILIRR